MTRAARLGMLGAVPRSAARACLSVVLWALASGCSSGTETGNPSFQAELSYTANSSMPLAIGVRVPGSQAVVQSAWLDLDTVALIGAGSCDRAEPTVSAVPALGIGDHASGNHNATLFALSAAEYCALDLPFVRAGHGDIHDGVPPDLEQNSIMLAGTLADGTPFTLLSAQARTVRLMADAGSFEISQNQAKTLITFDVATWLADLDWASAQRVDGAISISRADNPELLAQFESQLARGIALYRNCQTALEQAELRVKLLYDPEAPDEAEDFKPDTP